MGAVSNLGPDVGLPSLSSPTRSLPRSASSFEGRSVPATPVLTRGTGPRLCK